MYTFNNFCFGHKMSENYKLNNFIHDMDLEWTSKVSPKYEVSCPYHGGQINNDTYSVIFGINISDDDGNTDYISTVRSAKEEDYIEPYNKFLKEYILWLKTEDFSDCDDDELLTINELIKYLENTTPCFYSVEASS